MRWGGHQRKDVAMSHNALYPRDRLRPTRSVTAISKPMAPSTNGAPVANDPRRVAG
jgi:hypothetical protein